MLLSTITPWAPIGTLRREMDRLFGDMLPEHTNPFRQVDVMPSLNAWEDGDRYFVEAEVPGFQMADLNVEVLGNELILKGRRDVKDEDDNTHYLRRERLTGEFTRVLSLPADIDQSRVEAVLKDGILTVTLPKAETARAKRIEVHSS